MTPTVTADEIESHVICPRQYEFTHRRHVSPRESHTALVRDRRRRLLRNSIIAGLNANTTTTARQVDAAIECLNSGWSGSSYIVPAQQEYDKSVVKRAIEAYFEGLGEAHAANLIETDELLQYTRDDVTYEVQVDALVESDGGTLAIRYVPSLDGIMNVGWSDSNVQEYRSGSANYRRQIASFTTASMAIRSLISGYGLEHTVDFAYVGLLENARPTYEDDAGITVHSAIRRFRNQYQDEARDVSNLIESKAQAILDAETDPADSHFENILEKACEYCLYQDACPDYIESELSFTNRTPNQNSPLTDRIAADQPNEGDAE